MTIQSRAHADKGCAVSTNVILISSELAAFCGNSLEFLLGWGIGISNVHEQSFFTDADTVKLSDDLITDIAALKTATVAMLV